MLDGEVVEDPEDDAQPVEEVKEARVEKDVETGGGKIEKLVSENPSFPIRTTHACSIFATWLASKI